MPHLPAGVQHVDAELVAQPLERPRAALQHRSERGRAGGRTRDEGSGGWGSGTEGGEGSSWGG